MNNSTEEYNPNKHCCRYWYKDFCDCMKDNRNGINDKLVSNTLEFLQKNNIEYTNSNVDNIVVIPLKNKNLHLSLISEELMKCRFEGRAKWYTYSKNKFIDLIKNER